MVKKVLLGKLLIEQKERIGTENAEGLPLLGVNNKVGLHRSTDNKIKDLSNYKIVQRNWFAYNPMRINVGSLGLALTDEQVGVVSPDYVVFSCGENLSPHYLYRFLKSHTGMTEIRRNTTGTVRERLYFKSLAKIEIPLPSILEQIDISNKLKSTESILQQIIDKNTNQLDIVAKLRQAILQLAVQGKLVSQDPKDEPASVLLEKIRAENERLIKEGKIKKPKLLPPIKSDEIPYELPNEWEWVRLGEISTLKSGSTINKNLEIGNENAGVPYIKVGAMNLAGNERTISVSNSYVKVTENLQKYIIPENSIIFPKRGGAIATNKKRIVSSDIFADSNVMAMTPNTPMRLDYLFCWFMHIDLWQLNSGTSVPQINNKDIAPLLFSLPPLNEQKRIVAKVDELMALCDELESRLSQSQTDCDRLMEAAVAEILAA